MAEILRKQFEVLVVGAGPAGLAAAASAAQSGARVGILDDNPDLGGQIWRGESSSLNSDASKWADQLHSAHVETFFGAHVVHHSLPTRRLFVETRKAFLELGFENLIVATGARERFLPFPGWTLPNVMAAGGLQAMVKSGLPIANKRVVVAGTGPLLLAVAAYLTKAGAKVVAICEQSSWSALGRFAVGLWPHPEKIAQALMLRRSIRGISFRANTWPVRALGKEALTAVVLSCNGKTRELACDYLACGFHLIPNTELASLLGCRLRDDRVQVDEMQQTSIPGVFCAGEPTGIGGLEMALIKGKIAGMAAAGQGEQTCELRRKRNKAQKFANRLETAFALRPELKALPAGATIVCRCEDVTHARAVRHTSWRDAKNQTRCGMGPCQGRVCGPATQFLYGWRPESIRPPLFPARIETLSAIHQTGGSR